MCDGGDTDRVDTHKPFSTTSGTNADSTGATEDDVLSPFPLEVLEKIIRHVPRPSLINLLTVNTVFNGFAQRRLYTHLDLFKGPLPSVGGTFNDLLRVTETVDIFPHDHKDCEALDAAWNSSKSSVHGHLVRIHYDEEMAWYGMGTIYRTKPTDEAFATTIHDCKFVRQAIHAPTVIYRNTTLSLERSSSFALVQNDNIVFKNPGCCTDQIVQVLLPNHLLEVSPGNPDTLDSRTLARLVAGNRPIKSAIWVLWTPGPGIKWPEAEEQDMVDNWLRLQPTLHMMERRSPFLMIVNADALLDAPDGPCRCATPHFCHGFLPYLETVLAAFPEEDRDAIRQTIGHINFISMPDFIRNGQWEMMFKREEIAGWLEVIENDNAEDRHEHEQHDENHTPAEHHGNNEHDLD